MKMSIFLKYLQNSKKVLKSYHNPLKRVENLALKDALEKEFYDKEAEHFLQDFEESLFLYDENEVMPLSHSYFYSLFDNIKNKKILDCCCGHGFTSVKCAKRGAEVTGIDISPKMIELSRKNAAFNDVQGKTHFAIMSVQEMDFENELFDYAVGIGALHHLNLDLAGREISRVLKTKGRAIFLEPRIPFKWLIFVRSIFPNRCFESPGGSQLNEKDIGVISAHFASTRISYFMLLKKLARLPLLHRVSSRLEGIDLFLIRRFPCVKRLCWAFVLEFTK